MSKSVGRISLCVLPILMSILLLASMPASALANDGESLVAERAYTSSITDEQIAQALEGISKTENNIQVWSDEESNDSVIEFSGSNRYQTNALQAMHGWEQSDYAILTTGQNWVDALSASGLAGALECPILLTKPNALPDEIAEVIQLLGIKKVIILGGEGAVSAAVEEQLIELGAAIEERLAGETRYETQLEIFLYGVDKGYWSIDHLIVASGAEGAFADVLSASPLAYAQRMPIFLVNEKGSLNDNQETALVEFAAKGYFKNPIIVGGTARVSGETEEFLDAVRLYASEESDGVARLSGATRWKTSACVTEWAVEQGFLIANGVSFASGVNPYDALGGGVLQGRLGSVMLLVGDGNCDNALAALSAYTDIVSVKFFGGKAAVSETSRNYILSRLGFISGSITTHYYDVTLDEAIKVELASSSSYTYDEYLSKMNPSNWAYGDSGFYQFAILSDGYSGAATAEEINSFIDKMVVYQEENYGVTSSLRGTGQYFIDAAQQYNVNEIYLLAHAAIESAWGCSTLAQGYKYDGTIEISGKTYPAGTYYNFYGIGAYDDSPLSGGRSMAVQNGWNSIENAICGAASWLSRNYIDPTVSSSSVSGDQDTLWKMKWDVERIVTEGSCWHQYATGITWAVGIAQVMDNCYSGLGLDMDSSGLSFEIPQFKEA